MEKILITPLFLLREQIKVVYGDRKITNVNEFSNFRLQLLFVIYLYLTALSSRQVLTDSL